ncbi:MAG: DUF2730 family protein [Rhodospirillaceae bacterium]|nr:DUF2730 family protein [Rhodospirillaceae bacterium]
MDWLDWLKLVGPALLSVIVLPVLRWSIKRGIDEQVISAVAPIKAAQVDFQKFHTEEHKILDRRLQEGEVRFAKTEAALQHLPTKEDLEDLNRSLATVHSGLAGLAATMDGMRGAVTGLQETVNMLVQNEIKGARE